MNAILGSYYAGRSDHSVLGLHRTLGRSDIVALRAQYPAP